ncbi:Sec-independent protein translocase subunit TatA [Kitasatospora sp. NPDC056181]|uniref:Sec-independent protein translocase subunit TatA n=1 Tax=Kitasatospora sp. NPDC056181 TaxID=3345737 RepID=UPI0035DEA284
MLRNAFEPWHLLVVVAVIALLFGSHKLPELARGLGRSMRILKAETRAMREDGPEPDAGPGTPPAVETSAVTGSGASAPARTSADGGAKG